MEHHTSAGATWLAPVGYRPLDHGGDCTPGTGAAPADSCADGSRGHIDFREQFPYDSELVKPPLPEAGFERSIEPAMLGRETIQTTHHDDAQVEV